MEQDTKLIRKIKKTFSFNGFKAFNVEKHIITEKDDDWEGETIYFFDVLLPNGDVFYDERCMGTNLNEVKYRLIQAVNEDFYDD